MKTKEELLRKLHGWHGTYRGKFLLLQRKILTKEEYLLYDLSVAIADWDMDDHPNTYGTFDLLNLELEYFISAPQGYVTRYGKKLYKLKLWQKLANGRVHVAGFNFIKIKPLIKAAEEYKLIDPQQQIAELQPTIANSQESNADLQSDFSKATPVNRDQKVANLQTISPISDVISSKDNLLIVPIKRTDEEYEAIVKEGHYEYMTTDDMKWVDANVLY